VNWCITQSISILCFIRKIHECLLEGKFIPFSHHGKWVRDVTRQIQWKVIITWPGEKLKASILVLFMSLKGVRYKSTFGYATLQLQGRTMAWILIPGDNYENEKCIGSYSMRVSKFGRVCNSLYLSVDIYKSPKRKTENCNFFKITSCNVPSSDLVWMTGHWNQFSNHSCSINGVKS